MRWPHFVYAERALTALRYAQIAYRSTGWLAPNKTRADGKYLTPLQNRPFDKAIRARSEAYVTKQSSTQPKKAVKDPRDLTIGSLHAFMCVVELGSVSKAADYLGLTQSTVTRQLQALEDILDAKLLTKKIPKTLTENGELIHQVVKDILYKLFMFDEYKKSLWLGDELSEQVKENLQMSLIFSNPPQSPEDVSGDYLRKRPWNFNLRQSASEQ